MRYISGSFRSQGSYIIAGTTVQFIRLYSSIMKAQGNDKQYLWHNQYLRFVMINKISNEAYSKCSDDESVKRGKVHGLTSMNYCHCEYVTSI